MNSQTVAKAIVDHLLAVDDMIGWVAVFALVAAWGGLQRKRVVTLGGFSVNRNTAFKMAATVYIAASVSMSLLFLRATLLLKDLPQSEANTMFTQITTTASLWSPLAYFGKGIFAHAAAALSYIVFFGVQYLCAVSGVLIADNFDSRFSKALVLAFACTAYFVQGTVQGFGQFLAHSIDSTQPLLAADYAIVLERHAVIANVMQWIVVPVIFILTLLRHKALSKMRVEQP